MKTLLIWMYVITFVINTILMYTSAKKEGKTRGDFLADWLIIACIPLFNTVILVAFILVEGAVLIKFNNWFNKEL